MKSLPLNRCNAVQVQTCSGCVALQDPYCAWNLQTNACVDHRFVDGDGLDASALVQDIFRGKHAACTSGFQGTFRPKPQDPSPAPPEERPEEAEGTSDATGTPAPQATQKKMYDELLDIDIVIQENDIPYYEDRAMSSAQSAAALYTGETLTIASVLICLFSIVIGFAVGFLVSRKIAKGDYNSCGHHYLETQRNLNKYVIVNLPRVRSSGSSLFTRERKETLDRPRSKSYFAGKTIPSTITTSLATPPRLATTLF